MSHTPGPWAYEINKADGGSAVSNWYRILGEDGVPVAVTMCLQKDLNATDNARLIAAAPELLVACKKALDDLRSTPSIADYLENSVNILSDAIGKAEGKDQ